MIQLILIIVLTHACLGPDVAHSNFLTADMDEINDII
jgi:hypothetical protein